MPKYFKVRVINYWVKKPKQTPLVKVESFPSPEVLAYGQDAFLVDMLWSRPSTWAQDRSNRTQ